ncbi:hypothetical protein FBEOM_720 [Fusarium beomiforme]|uniref:Uncharacterized protein n=1 Tax=Fusarium beomiforme TaxID=44412 RepID=A0A9P5AVB9_9HYPO|nr:hypothetical protein FBEOM_720 [Fusarium beomiforme]
MENKDNPDGKKPSGALPFRPWDTHTRRQMNISNESGSGSQPSTSTAAKTSSPVAITARYRAAWPVLRPLPLCISRKPFPAGVNPSPMTFLRQVIEILKRYQVYSNETKVDFVMREQQGLPNTAVPTLLIIAPWSQSVQGTWKSVTEAIAKRTTPGTGVHVEMIAPELSSTVYYSPVRNQPKLSQSWDKIRAHFFQKLEQSEATKGKMTAIALFRYGLSSHRNTNPITIYISVNYSSDETKWQRVISLIEVAIRLLDPAWKGVHVHIEHNEGMQTAFTIPELEGTASEIRMKMKENNMRIRGDYSVPVNLGDDISMAGYLIRSDDKKKPCSNGTLGCYIWIKTKSNPKWVKYALTNYHVIRPGIGGFVLIEVNGRSVQDSPKKRSDLWRTDLTGWKPGCVLKIFSVESPGRNKHAYTIWAIEDEIKQISATQAKLLESAENAKELEEAKDRNKKLEDGKEALIREKDAKLEFFEKGKHTLGQLYAASGFTRRSEENFRLDWALIQVKKAREGSNRLPGEEEWEQAIPELGLRPYATFDKPLKQQKNSLLPLPQPKGGSTLPYTETLYKKGSRTGVTKGSFYDLKASCQLKDDDHVSPRPSNEFIFMSDSAKDVFAAPGDSGSIAYDSTGAVLGLLHRGHQPNGTNDEPYAYVTPIELIFKDIKEFLNDDAEIRIVEE